MISKNTLQAELTSSKKDHDSSEFFHLHKSMEAYIKRVLLIGLRLNGVRYEESEKIISRTYLKTPHLIDKVLFLLDATGRSQSKVISRLKNKYKDFFTLRELVLKFSSKHRNQFAHGTVHEISDTEVIRYLCHVNKSFFNEFENLLQSQFGHSAFEKPGEWGAKKGNKEKIEVSSKRLGLGKILEEPLTLQVVKNRLATTKYPKP